MHVHVYGCVCISWWWWGREREPDKTPPKLETISNPIVLSHHLPQACRIMHQKLSSCLSFPEENSDFYVGLKHHRGSLIRSPGLHHTSCPITLAHGPCVLPYSTFSGALLFQELFDLCQTSRLGYKQHGRQLPYFLL